MRFPYTFKLLFILPATGCFMTGSIQAQNTPLLNQTNPPGITTVIDSVPELSSSPDPNYIVRFTPVIPITNAATITSAQYPEQIRVSAVQKDGFNRTAAQFDLSSSREGGLLRDRVQVFDHRVQREHYSFLPHTQERNTGINNGILFQYQKDWYQANYPGEGYTPYSKQKYYSDASTRQTQSYAPGKSQVGQNRMTRTTKTANIANEVRIWNLNASGNPVSGGWYKANELFGEKVEDPENKMAISYTDKDGRMLLRQVLDSTFSSAGITQYVYQSTYYVYDDMGRLRYTFPPKATEAIINNNWTVSTTIRDNLCFQYQYDDKGRLSAQRKPGETGFTYVIYDRKQRPVLRQTPGERSGTVQWEVTFYDRQGRVNATSLFNNTSSQATWQSLFDNYAGASYATNNIRYYILTDAGEGVYPAENAVSGNTMMSYTYYDGYRAIDPNDNLYNTCTGALAFTPDLLSTPGSETPERSLRSQGLVTGSRVRILPAPGADVTQTGDWRQSGSWHDDKGRVIYSLSSDLYQGNAIHTHYTGSQYDFAGRLLITKHVFINNNSADGTVQHTELTKNIYDPETGRLTEAGHKVDGGVWKILAKYEYDGLGRVKKEVLGNGGEQRDYDYNIRGQVTGINAAYAETGTGTYSRSFGESLKYDYGMTDLRYDGKIAGMVWRGAGGTAARMMAYGYDYDLSGRMKSAKFSRWETNQFPIGWSHGQADRSLDNLFYDKNGNILSKRMQAEHVIPVVPYSMGMTIDSLSYTYEPLSNRLNSVSDGIDTNYNIGDFQDGHTDGPDYAYDANGNLSKDLNKGITAITYTHFNKPQTITFSNGNKISYSYDAGGGKVQELVQEGASTKRTGYLGNFIYQNDSLQYALTGPGRTVWQNGAAQEEFFVKDHLGNVRSVIDVYQWPLLQYLVGYEIASANLETLIFDQVDEIRDDKPGGTGPGDEQAGRLNGNEQDHQVGTSILLKVMAGDKVELSVDNYYNEYMPEYDEPLNAEDLLGSIVSTLTIGDGGFEGSESHNADLVERMFSPENYILADDLMHSEAEETKPKAFLNYILFNNKMEVVSTFTGAFQVDGEGAWSTIGTTAPLVIPEGGYLAIFESTQTRIQCEGCQVSVSDVYFDHLMIRFTRGQLKEESHYYPFGLPMGDMGSAAAGFTPNRRKYQGNEYIKEAGLNWMDFNARQYDPQIGRFLSVDPLASSGGQDRFSPYAAMGNEPGSMVDPNGMREQHWQNQTSAGIFIDPMIPAGSWMTNPLMEGTMGISSADMMTVVNIGGSGGTGQNMTMGQLLNFLETAPPGSYSFINGQIICNYGAGAGGSPDDGDDGGKYDIEGNINATNLPEGSSMPGTPIEQTAFGKAVNEFFTDITPIIGEINMTLKYATGTSVWGEKSSGMSPFEAIIPVAGRIEGKSLSVAEQAAELSNKVGKNRVSIKTTEGELHFDLKGAEHRGISTPHVQRSLYNSNSMGKTFLNKDNQWVKPMTQQDIRILRNYIKKL